MLNDCDFSCSEQMIINVAGFGRFTRAKHFLLLYVAMALFLKSTEVFFATRPNHNIWTVQMSGTLIAPNTEVFLVFMTIDVKFLLKVVVELDK
jgi:hypothetical protein